MAGRGGARPGAGRKKDSRNKRTQAMVDAAQRIGLSPHELLCAVSQNNRAVLKSFKPTWDMRIECAKAAAPYYAPRLHAVAAKVQSTGEDEDVIAWIMGKIDGKTRGLPGGTVGPAVAAAKPILDKRRKR